MNAAVKLWQDLGGSKRDIATLTEEELSMLWQYTMKELYATGALGRVNFLQTEIIRRESSRASASATRLAKYAFWISVVATVGTLAQLVVAFIK